MKTDLEIVEEAARGNDKLTESGVPPFDRFAARVSAIKARDVAEEIERRRGARVTSGRGELTWAFQAPEPDPWGIFIQEYPQWVVYPWETARRVDEWKLYSANARFNRAHPHVDDPDGDVYSLVEWGVGCDCEDKVLSKAHRWQKDGTLPPGCCSLIRCMAGRRGHAVLGVHVKGGNLLIVDSLIPKPLPWSKCHHLKDARDIEIGGRWFMLLEGGS